MPAEQAQLVDAKVIAPAEPENQVRGRADQEDIRLLTGFTDIFSAFVLGGLLSFIGALGALTGGLMGGLLVAAAAWFLTRYFVTKRQFAACAILLAIAFGMGITGALAPFAKWFAPLVAAAALWFYWKHYKVPISAALAIIFAVLGPVILFFNPNNNFSLFNANLGLNTTLIFVGLLLFCAGIYWDTTDRERVTRRSDVAFWLHLLAGPLMVHGTFSLLGIGGAFGLATGSMMSAQANTAIWPVFVLVSLFALVAIIVDRRPLLIASFSYLVFAIGALAYRQLSAGQIESAEQFPAVLMTATMVTGALIVVLAGTWSQIRRQLLSLLPVRMAERLAPLEEWTLPADANAHLPDGEKEPLRLIHGLNDYMAAVGMASLFIGSLAAGFIIAKQLIAPDGTIVPENAIEFQSQFSGFKPWVAIIVPALVVGLLAAFFVRVRRMALTGVAASFQFWLLTLFAIILLSMQLNLGNMGNAATGVEPEFNGFSLVLGCVLAAAANFTFWWYNRIPVAFALGFATLFPLLFPEFIHDPDNFGQAPVAVRAMIFGLIAFGVAMIWDRRDPQRTTQKSDNGFWMHLLAALFFIPSAYGLIGAMSGLLIAKLLFFAILIAVALVIDRRAMLLVALPTLVGAIAGNNDDALGISGAVLLFAALTLLNLYWDQVRSRLLPARSTAVE